MDFHIASIFTYSVALPHPVWSVLKGKDGFGLARATERAELLLQAPSPWEGEGYINIGGI